MNLALALGWAVNPEMLLMDQMGVTPIYVTRNELFISKNLQKHYENNVESKFEKETMKKILEICPYILSPLDKEFAEAVLKMQFKTSQKKDPIWGLAVS